MQLVTTTNRRRDEMSRKLITTISLVVALATFGAVSTATAEPNTRLLEPRSLQHAPHERRRPHGMMNDTHVFDIMIPLVGASLGAGCIHP